MPGESKVNENLLKKVIRESQKLKGWKYARFIDSGSFGAVVEIKKGGKRCALKMIPIPLKESELRDRTNEYGGDVQMLKREFDTQARTVVDKEIKVLEQCKGQPNIVQIYDWDIVPNPDNNICCYVLIRMELLCKLLDHLTGKTHRDVLIMFQDIARALDFLANYRILHRDIKVANIMVSTNNEYKLTDFGEARDILRKSAASTAGVGTPYFMAPEVIESQPYDAHADIYSLGMTVYYLLANLHYPFQSSSSGYGFTAPEAYEMRKSGRRIPPIPNVDDRLNEILLRCLEYDPMDRYPDVHMLYQDVTALVNSRSFVNHKLNFPNRVGTRSKSHKALWIVLGCVATACVAVAIIVFVVKPWPSPNGGGESTGAKSYTLQLVWDDDDNRDGGRDAVRLNLWGEVNGVRVNDIYSLDVDPADSDEALVRAFENLPRDYNGSEIKYAAGLAGDVSLPEGYTYQSSFDGKNTFVFTLKHEPEMVDVDVEVIWDDKDDWDGLRKDATLLLKSKVGSVSVMQDVKFVASAQSEDSSKAWRQYRYFNGEEIEYSIQAGALEGYDAPVVESTIDAETGSRHFSVTYTHEVKTVSVDARLRWDDADNQDGLRVPVTMRLIKSVEADGQSEPIIEMEEWVVEPDAEDSALDWRMEDLPEYKNGKRITYMVDAVVKQTVIDADGQTREEELPGPEGYERVVDGNAITYRHVPSLRDIEVALVWDDGDDQDGRRAPVTLVLTGQNAVGDEVCRESVVTDSDYSFEELPVNDSGAPIDYALEIESIPEGYSWTVESADAQGNSRVVTLHHVPGMTDAHIHATWEDGEDGDGLRAPVELALAGYVNGEQVTGPFTRTLDIDADAQTFDFIDELPEKYRGEKIDYRLEEIALPEGYEYEVVPSEAGSDFRLTFRHAPTPRDLELALVWEDDHDRDGLRESIEVVKAALVGRVNDLEVGREPIEFKVAADEDSSRELMAVRANHRGQPIAYTLEADGDVEGYEASCDGITLTLTHEYQKTSIPASFVWKDNNNQDSLRQPLTLTLVGTVKGQTAPVKEATWRVSPDAAGQSLDHIFDALPVYDHGREIHYALSAPELADYEMTVEGYAVTYAHDVWTKDIVFEWIWADDDDRDGLRDEVALWLIGYVGQREESRRLESIHPGTEAVRFTGLPVNLSGQGIRYEWKLDSIPADYVLLSEETEIGYRLTCKHDPETTNVKVHLIWDDEDNQDDLRASVKVTLKGEDGSGHEVYAESVETIEDYTFAGVPVNHQGEPIRYSITQQNVPTGYTSSVNGFEITNKHKPGVVSISAHVVWDDGEDADGLRAPAVLTLRGYVGNEPVTEPYTWTVSADEQEQIFDFGEELPEKYNGKSIEYRMIETGLSDAYASEISMDGNNFIVTNRHAVSTSDIQLTVVWDDDGDRDGLRASIGKVKTVLVGRVDGDEVSRESMTFKTVSTGNRQYDYRQVRTNHKGKPIAYTLEPDGAVLGYEITSKDLELTYRHEVEKVDLQVHVRWEDGDDQDGLRQPVTLRLESGAKGEYGQARNTVLVADNIEDRHTFAGMYVNDGGLKIEYSVEAEAPDGYSMDLTWNEAHTTCEVVYTHVPEVRDIAIAWRWEDGDNQDGLRAPFEAALIGIVGDVSTEIGTFTITADSGRTAFDKLPVYANGQSIRYEMALGALPDGYASVGDDYTFTFQHTPEMTRIPVRLTWDDQDDQDGLRSPLKVVLKGVDSSGKVVHEDSIETIQDYEFVNVPVYHQGEAIQYSITAKNIPMGYTSTLDGFEIKSVHKPGVVSFLTRVVWDDGENADGLRKRVQMELVGTDGVKTWTLSTREVGTSANEQSFLFEDMPQKSNGKKIVYDVKLIGLPEAYQYTAGRDGNNFVVTCRHAPTIIDIDASLIWKDDNDRDGLRQSFTTVKTALVGRVDGEVVSRKQVDFSHVSMSNVQKKTLHVNANHLGRAVGYTLEMDGALEGYDITSGGLNLVCTHEPEKMNIAVNIAWEDSDNQDGLRAPLTLRLIGRASGRADSVYTSKTVTFDELGQTVYAHAFDAMPVNHKGQKITYQVALDIPDEYAMEASWNDDHTACDIVLVHDAYMRDITVAWQWDDGDNQDGKRKSVEVGLNGIMGDETIQLGPETIGTAGGQVVFSDLPVNHQGEPIRYEPFYGDVPAADYTVEVKETATGFAFTARHKPEVTTVSVGLVWVDGNNQDGLRKKVKVTLKGVDPSGKTVYTDSATVNRNHTFANVPVYDRGQRLSYKISSDKPQGYAVSIDDTKRVVTLTHQPNTIDIHVQAVWDDKGNQDGLRKNAKFSVKGYVDNTAVGESRVYEVDAGSDEVDITIEDLPEKYQGKAIEYRLANAESIGGYKATFQGSGTERKVTYKHTPAYKSITATLIWDDNGDQDGMRKGDVEVMLRGTVPNKKEAVYVARQVFSVAKVRNRQYCVFYDVPKYDQGVEISYALVVGTPPSGYTTSKDGYNVTLSHTPETCEVIIKVVWDDMDDQDGLRAESIAKIGLEAVNEVSDETVGTWEKVITASDGAVTFADLPFYDKGVELIYKVNAISTPTGYTYAYGNNTVTYRHTPVPLPTLEYPKTVVFQPYNKNGDVTPMNVKIRYEDGTALDKENIEIVRQKNGGIDRVFKGDDLQWRKDGSVTFGDKLWAQGVQYTLTFKHMGRVFGEITAVYTPTGYSTPTPPPTDLAPENGQVWDLSVSAPAHVWICITTDQEKQPACSLYSGDKVTTVDRNDYKKYWKRENGGVKYCWLLDLSSMWGTLQNAYGRGRVTLKITGTIGDGQSWDNPSYELKTKWYGWTADEVRTAMIKDGYQTDEQPASTPEPTP